MYAEDLQWSLELPGNRGVGKLFGCVRGIGSDPRIDAFVVRDETSASQRKDFYSVGADFAGPRRWQNVLMIDSNQALGVLSIGDAGYLLLLAHESDLRAGRFDRIYAQLESS